MRIQKKLLWLLFNAQAEAETATPLRCRGQKAEASLKKLWLQGCFVEHDYQEKSLISYCQQIKKINY